MAGNLVISTINGGAIGTKNAIINGNFGVNQRGVSGSVTLAAGAYGHDRWKAGASGCTYTFATSNNVTTLTITAGTLQQVIEGLNLQSGSYILSWTGTAQGRVDSGSYGASGVTGTAVGGTNQTIEFGTGTVSLVQYEKGSVATPFENRPYGTELGLCQRYFIQYGPNASGNNKIGSGVVASATSAAISFPAQPMRATPTVSFNANTQLYDASVSSTITSVDAVGLFGPSVSVQFTASVGGLSIGRGATVRADASLGYISFSSEL